MAAAFLTRGVTAVRDAVKAIVTNIGVSTDSTAFAVGQTRLDPTGNATNLIKAATITNVDASTFDATITINGTTEFTGKSIMTIGAMNGATATDVLSRSVRGAGLGIGVQAGDSFTVGVRGLITDQT